MKFIIVFYEELRANVFEKFEKEHLLRNLYFEVVDFRNMKLSGKLKYWRPTSKKKNSYANMTKKS